MQISLRQLLMIVLIVSLLLGAAVNTVRSAVLFLEVTRLRIDYHMLQPAKVEQQREQADFNEQVLNSTQAGRDSADIIFPKPRPPQHQVLRSRR
jgi:hypothetical protein